MGGTIIETESEKLIRKGIQIIIEIGQDAGLDDAAILNGLQDKAGLTQEQAAAYLEEYGGSLHKLFHVYCLDLAYRPRCQGSFEIVNSR